MKIALIIHSLSAGGSERVTANLSSHGAETGWEVFVVTLVSQDCDFYKLHPLVRRIGLGLADESTNGEVAI